MVEVAATTATTPDTDQSGASAVMFVFVLFALLGVALLAVDGGLLWVSQRGQVAEADSGVLAAARALASDPCTSVDAAAAAADELIDVNDPRTQRRGPLQVARSSACAPEGVVSLQTTRDSIQIFAGAFGFGDTPTRVTSLARYGFAPAVADVRPIALCSADRHYQEWETVLEERRDGVDDDGDGTVFDEPVEGDYLALRNTDDPATPIEDHPLVLGAGVVHRLPYEQVGGSDCGTAPGNWGLVDFDEGSVGTPPIANWIRGGYEPGVDLGGAAPDCDAADLGDADDCPAGPGVRGAAIGSALADLVAQCPAGVSADSCPVIHLVVYDRVVDASGDPVPLPAPGGVTAYYDFVDVVGLVVRGYRVTGPSPYIDVEFVDRVGTGPVGEVPTGYTGPTTASLCGAGSFDENCSP